MKLLNQLAKTAALSTLDRSKHRGHDLWRDLRFFHERLQQAPDSILVDVGANVGQTAVAMAKIFPKARIFSFEPCSTTFIDLKRNTSFFPNIFPEQCALGDTVEKREIYLNEFSTTNSFIHNETNVAQSEEVNVTSLVEFARERGIKEVFLLKTDTEGFDLSVLRGALPLLEKKMIDYILVETCFYRKMVLPQSDFGEISAYLAQLDYHFVHIYETVCATDGGQVLWCNSLFTCR